MPSFDHGEEGADDGGEEDDQDHRDANGPDAGKEQRVQDVVLVDEGLSTCQYLARKKTSTRAVACRPPGIVCAP